MATKRQAAKRRFIKWCFASGHCKTTKSGKVKMDVEGFSRELANSPQMPSSVRKKAAKKFVKENKKRLKQRISKKEENRRIEEIVGKTKGGFSDNSERRQVAKRSAFKRKAKQARRTKKKDDKRRSGAINQLLNESQQLSRRSNPSAPDSFRSRSDFKRSERQLRDVENLLKGL